MADIQWPDSLPDLSERIALVTGASRGVGRGVARALGAAGATVYVTGRTSVSHRAEVPLPGTIESTAALVSSAGGRGIPLRCDHRDDDQVRSAVDTILAARSRIDILVNNAWAGYQPLQRAEHDFEQPFWTLPLSHWDDMFQVGVRSTYVASALVAPSMVQRRRGLIVNVSYYAGASYHFNAAYGVAKAAVDRLSQDMAHELRDFGIASVSLWPGTVRTEMNMHDPPADLDDAESPEFIGLAVVALAADPDQMQSSGQVLKTRELARTYGYTDVDGRLPPLGRGLRGR